MEKKPRNILVKIIFIPVFVILLTSNIKATSGNTKEVDSLLNLAKKASDTQSPTQTIFFARKALLYSEKIRDKEGMAESNFLIAFGLCNAGNYSESFVYINKLIKDYSDYIADNLDFRFKLTDLAGRNYLALGFRKQAIAEFKKELTIADLGSIQNEKLEKLYNANIQLSACYENYKSDSVIYYLNKVKAIHKNYHAPRHISKEVLYFNLANYYFYNGKRLDSASYYNEQLLKIVKTNPFDYFECSGFRQKAEILYTQKKYEESLEYSLKVLALAKKKSNLEDRISIYKLLADNYRALKRNEDELFYVNKYVSIKDSVAKASAMGIQISADRISDEIANSKNKSLNRKLGFVFLFLAAIIGIAIIGIKRIKKRNNNIIDLKENQINKLQDTRLDKAREELINLAKEDAPEITMKFKEAYPELNEKLLQIQPNLVNTEIAFCAYLKLNFTTKEIATFIGVTPRAVQIRKNRLRKKLNIPSDEDIYLWMDGL
ncbi:tetratricopeptide repeat protein [Chryseobacterium sp. IT-36CA2]|uniref:tetratricopeptide repeat protein n=1 Tax=Chryseobacterium sp. IT-36CA2 TaxID=3026460 RepID=UPI0039E086BE